MYKEALKQKLRVTTSKGPLSIEQLFDLGIPELDVLAVNLEEEYQNSKGKSFVAKKTQKDKTIKLKFDIVLDILNTKVEEAEAIATDRDRKQHNEKILTLIAKKQEGELEGKSIKELENMLK